jgi:membrane-associated phospholipid phosphatase
VDEDAFLWVYDHQTGWLDPVFIGLSAIGYSGLVWIALAPLLALRTRRSVLASTALTALCVWTADLAALALKGLTDRERPFDALDGVEPLFGGTLGGSLPSGHAATSFAGAVVLTYLFPRGAPAFFLLAIAIAFSRVYVGVHFPSDVLAGAALGAGVAGLILAAVRLRRPSEAGRPQSGAAPPGG